MTVATLALALVALSPLATAQFAGLGERCGTVFPTAKENNPCGPGLYCRYPFEAFCAPASTTAKLCRDEPSVKRIPCADNAVCVALEQTSFGGYCAALPASSSTAPAATSTTTSATATAVATTRPAGANAAMPTANLPGGAAAGIIGSGLLAMAIF